MPGVHMVLLTSLGDGFEAKCLAARLGAEGVLWELRGAVDGVYPLGTVDVLVDAADLDVAREVMSVVAGGVAVPADGDDRAPQSSRMTRGEMVVLGAGAMGLAGLVAARVLVLA